MCIVFCHYALLFRAGYIVALAALATTPAADDKALSVPTHQQGNIYRNEEIFCVILPAMNILIATINFTISKR